MDYYVKGDAAKAQEIKAAFEAKGIDTASNSLAHDEYLYYSSNGLLYFEEFYNALWNVFKTNPGYRELELPVEHEFKAEDWIVSTKDTSLTCRILEPNIINELGKLAYKVEIYSDGIYEKTCLIPSGKMDEWGRLWTIEDAKDGHVLVDEDTNTIGIFEKTYGICWHSKIYCAKSTYTKVYHRGGSHEIKFTKPATKEQRDLLFTRIREAGYEWDADKKEFRKTLKVGDWVAGIDDEGDMATEKIVSLSHNKVLLLDTDGCHTKYPKTELSNFHLWTIADAKDGDVLFSQAGNPFLFCEDRVHDGVHDITAYCGIDTMGNFLKSDGTCWTHDLPEPATKEQRDLLFNKMKEEGYEWDAGKRELRKIIEPNFKVGDKIKATIYGIERKVTIREVDKTNRCYFGTLEECIGFSEQDQWHLAPRLHYDISNFYAGMPVLVRDRDWENWTYLHYSHKVAGRFCAGGILCKQCIPFEGNERLVGTDEPCPEEYINW